MLRPVFHGFQDPFPALAGRIIDPLDIGYFRMSDRDGPRLIQHDRRNLGGDLQAVRIPDQDALRGPLPDAGNQGRRGGQSQRAGTGDDQHRHHGQQAAGDAVIGQESPAQEGQQGNPDDDRNENSGHLVHGLLDPRLAALRIPDHPDNSGQHRILPDFFGPDGQRALLVNGTGIHLGTGLLAVRQRLAGQHALIDKGAALRHDAVNGDPIPGTDLDQLTDPDADLLGLQADQLADGCGRSPLGPLFKNPAQQDEGNDHRGRLKIQPRLQAPGGPDLGEDQVEQTEEEGNAG